MTTPWTRHADAARTRTVLFMSPSLRLCAVQQFVRRAIRQLDLVHITVEGAIPRFDGLDGDLLADGLREIGAREADALVPGWGVALERPLLDLAGIPLRF